MLTCSLTVCWDVTLALRLCLLAPRRPPSGGLGPRLESWAYAVDRTGLHVLLQHAALQLRYCKHCTSQDGIVVGGEYGISKALLAEGYNFATLMSKYAEVGWGVMQDAGQKGKLE